MSHIRGISCGNMLDNEAGRDITMGCMSKLQPRLEQRGFRPRNNLPMQYPGPLEVRDHSVGSFNPILVGSWRSERLDRLPAGGLSVTRESEESGSSGDT